MNGIVRYGKIIAGLLLIFLLGGGTGSLVTLGVVRKEVTEPVTRDPRDASGSILQNLSQRLELTPEQRREIQPILLQAVREIRETRGRTMQEVVRIMQETDREILAALTPEQAERYERYREKQRERLQGALPRDPQHRPRRFP